MTSRPQMPPYELVENSVGRGNWLSIGFWVVTEQGLFGFGNFVLAVALARWLSPVEYGSFAAAYSMLQLVAVVHAALFIEPMLVFGQGRFRTAFPRYLGTVVGGHWGFSALMAAGLVAVGSEVWVSQGKVFGSSLLGFAVASPFMLLFWMMRRAFYVCLEPRLAAAVSAAYTLFIFGLLYALYMGGLLSAMSAPIAMGAASALLAAVTLLQLRVSAYGEWKIEQLRDVYRLHWRYGRWAIPTGALSWVPANAYCLALPFVSGLRDTAAFAAFAALVTPAQQTISAIAAILIPTLAQARQSGNVRPVAWVAVAGLSVASVAYVAVLGVAGEQLTRVVYGGHYVEHARFAWMMGLVAIPSSVIAVLGSTLRALERPDCVFWAYAVSATVTCTVGVATTAHWHLAGAIAGQLISYSVTALVMLHLLVGLSRSGDEALP